MENERFLRNPEFNTDPPLRLTHKGREVIKDVVKSTKLLSEFLVGPLKGFSKEASLLKSLIRRNKHQFVNDKGFRDLRLVSRSLDRLQEIRLESLLKNLYSAWPPTFSILEKPSESLGLVRQSDLRIVLIRIHQTLLLLEKIRDVYTLNAGENCFKRLALGHHWSLALAWLGSVSRICSIVSEPLMNILKESYDALSSLYRLKILQDEFPHEDPQLPLRLLESEKQLLRDCTLDDGVVLEREPPSIAEPILKRGKLIFKTFSTLKTPECLQKWIREETEERKVNRKKALSKPLSAEVWRSLKKEMGTLTPGEARERLLLYVLNPDTASKDGFPSNWNDILKKIRSKK